MFRRCYWGYRLAEEERLDWGVLAKFDAENLPKYQRFHRRRRSCTGPSLETGVSFFLRKIIPALAYAVPMG
jgi:hypothetical protein